MRKMKFDEAITYAERHALHALRITVDGEVAVTRTGDQWDPGAPHALYSGTKSYWGIAAAAAADDGLLTFDEPVCATISEWRAEERKRRVTIRQLLDLTSGHAFGGLGNAVPTAARALTLPLVNDPGSTFTYGGVPLQVFGEVLRRKVAPAHASPQAYLAARVLEPIGAEVDRWRTLADGTAPLPTGAFVRLESWLRYGQFLLERGAGALSATAFEACVTGSAANPKYGLGLWLHTIGDITAVYASGAGGQGLYVLPRRRIVAAHFGKSASWDHRAFIRRLAAAGGD